TIMSDSEDSMVTYTTVSSPSEGRSGDVSPGVDGPPVMPEDPYAYVVAAFQALPSPDYVPGPEELEQAPPSPPLPAAASPTTDLPGYIPESDPDEDPEDDDDEDLEEDPANYPADHDDDDDEEEEPSKDNADEDAKRFLAMPIPLPSPLTPLSSPLPQIPSPPLPASPPILLIQLPAASPPLQLLSSDRRADRPKVTLPPRKRLSIVHCPGYETGESSVAAATRPIKGRRENYGFVGSVEAEIRRRIAEDIRYGIRDTWIDPRDVAEEEALTTLEGVNTRVTELAAVQEQDTQDIYGVIEDTQGRQTKIFQRVEALVDDSQYHYETGRLVDLEAIVSREDWAHSIGLSFAVYFELQGYMTHTWGHLVTALGDIQVLQTREQARTGAPEGAGSSTKMAPKRAAPRRTTRLNPARDSNRTGDDSHTSGTGVRRTKRVTRECTYQDFMKCQPLYFKGTEGVVELTQWFERIETVFCISNCLVENQKIRTYAERQAANKRKFEDTSRNKQGRQQPPKRQDVARAYAAGSGNGQQYA
nr:hypothetical protein [Tanacetum cinerariifolium]